MGTAFDFLSSLLDEIALEGLDGITLETLWHRLSDRPDFPISLDDDSKSFFWDIVAKHKDVEIYELPEPRKFVPLYNRYDNIDPELGVVLEPAEKIPDPYFPVVQIKDEEVRGSCSVYYTRKNITGDIRCGNEILLVSLSQAVKKYGDSLVLVGSPKLRLLSLIGTEANPLMDLTLESYCMLERIGRSRYLGEVTQGEGGLISLKAPFCKQLHYYRKKLSEKGLITKQMHYMKMNRGQTSNGCLFHLTRFYVQRKTKMATLMKKLCDLLKVKPGCKETCKVVREELGIKDNTFKKLFYRPFQRWVKLQTVSCKDFYTEGTKKDWYTVTGHEKVVKIVVLVRHCDEEEDDDEEDNNGHDRIPPANVHFDNSRVVLGVPLVVQVLRHIHEAGPEGISSGDLCRLMTLPRLDVRGLLRTLTKKGEVVSMLQDRGRQKVTKYISKVYEAQNEAYSTLKEDEEARTKEMEGVPSVKREAAEDEDENAAPKKKKVRFADNGDKENKEVLIQNVKDSNFHNIVSKVLEVHSNDVTNGNSPKLISFSSDEPNVSTPANAAKMTFRKLKRANMILSHLKTERIATIADLQKVILERELEEGYNYKLDKKSTTRLVNLLHCDKKIKKYIAELELESERAKIEFICENTLQQSDPLIQVAIEQAKFKYFSVSKEAKKSSGNQLNSSFTDQSLSESLVEEGPKELEKEKEMKGEILHKYPLMTPKYKRAKSLHVFLHYLVYQHKAEMVNSNEQVVYNDSMSWKRFVPPLPNYGRNEGWCFLADIYTRMPLSLFLKIVNFRQGVPGLNNYLENEEKANYLIKFLPQHLRNNLLNNRKYLFSTNDVIRVLCYMGLLSIGPQVGKHKDQIFLYVHKRASIKDTTTSVPGYIHVKTEHDFDVKKYTFDGEEEVENYWLDLESTCFHTPLGKFSAAAGKTITIVEANFKPMLMETVKSKGFDDVTDTGEIPGDGLGAGGFDSVLFMHSKRNWQPPATGVKPLSTSSKSEPVLNSLQHLLQTSQTAKPESRSRLQRLTKSSLLLQKENKWKVGKKASAKKAVVVEPPQPKFKQKVKIRTLKAKQPYKKKLPYYDEKDKAAMEKLDKSRCDWSPQEDSFLLLCKVASCFLDPLLNNKNLAVPYTVVRDLLHDHVPDVSVNKSSRACQRRVRYMMMNTATANNVQVFLGEALQDSALVSEFSKPMPPKSNEQVWKNMFTVVLNKLREKFTLPASDRCKNMVLPESLESFADGFEILKEDNIFDQSKIYKDPTNEDEARKYVLITLILSAMAVAADGTWSYLLQKLYQCYPDSFLHSAVSHLRKEKVIAVQKNTCRTQLKRSLKSTFPYKFSISYTNSLLTKFPIRIFRESKDLIDNLNKLKPETNVELKGNIPPGYAASVLALVSTERLVVQTQIPDQIILFDSSLSKDARKNIVERMIHALSDKESVELSKLLNSENRLMPSDNDESTNDHSAVVHVSEMEDQDMLMNEDDLSNSQTSEVYRSSNASRFALYLLRQEMSQPPIEKVQHSQDYIVLNSCRVFCRLKPATHKSLPVNPSEIIETTHDWNKTAESEYMTKEKMVLTENRIEEIKKLVTSYIPSDALLAKHSKENQDSILESSYEQYSPQTVLDAICIFHYIYDAGWKGVTEKQVWKSFLHLPGELSVFHHLRRFRDASLVIRSGVTSFTYICMSFANNWVLTSFPLSEMHNRKDIEVSPSKSSSQADDPIQASDDKKQMSGDKAPVSSYTRAKTLTKIYFIPRTWRTPDGTLNKPVFFNLLSTVLSKIIASPGTSTNQLCEHFFMVLPPVQTLELVEILEKGCCIYKYYCAPLKKCTLFSRPQQVLIKENPEPDDLEHLEPYPDAVCKIAHLMSVL